MLGANTAGLVILKLVLDCRHNVCSAYFEGTDQPELKNVVYSIEDDLSRLMNPILTTF